MGIRYRRSVKIMPGVRINFSKSGISTTIGPRGASVNIGKNGTYLNTGIPGTGIYMRERIGGQAKTRQSSSARTGTGTDAEFMKAFNMYQPNLLINNLGKIQIVDKDRNVITDETFIRKMKKMNSYKTIKDGLMSQWREQCEQLYQEKQSELSELVNIHRQSLPVYKKEDYEQMLSDVEKKTYLMESFAEKEPERAEVMADLTAEAELQVKSKAFWRVKKLREQYVREHLEARYIKLHSEWEEKKKTFEQNQQKEAEKQNALYTEEYETKCAAIRDKIAGSEEYVKSHFEEWLSECSLPVEINVDYEYEADTSEMRIDLMLPSEDVIPKMEYVKLANGGVDGKEKARATIQAEYASLIFGLGIYFASGAFNISPVIKRVLLSGFGKQRDKDGDVINVCLYSIKFDRNRFEEMEIREEPPIWFINQFENRYKATQTWIFKAITPFQSFFDE